MLPEKQNEAGKSETSEPPRKKQRGQNRNRPRDKRVPPSERLCPSLKVNLACSFGENCYFSHDIASYMAHKPPDIGERCILFELHGECPYGLECRFGKSHISSDFKNIKQDVSSDYKHSMTHSWLSKELQEQLHKKTVKFPHSENFLSKLESTKTRPSKPTDHNDIVGTDNEEQTCKRVGPVSDEDIVKPRISEKKMVCCLSKNVVILQRHDF